MKIFYSDTYQFPLTEGHRFPIEKYELLREALIEEDIVKPSQLFLAPLISRESLLTAHSADYVNSFLDGTIDTKAIRRIGLPWSPEFTARALASVGGTVAASEIALSDGISGNLAGGTHHAFREYGEGFCVFNDIAVAALMLLQSKSVSRVAVIDLDVHQGNGTAEIFMGEERVMTLSMHGRNNFPFRKVSSTLDIPLDDGTQDEEYLTLLSHLLPQIIRFDPDIIFYQAGVDPLKEDSLGKLALSHDGLRERDRLVLQSAYDYDIPIVLTLGGGYSKPIQASVEAYAGTYRVAMKIFPSPSIAL